MDREVVETITTEAAEAWDVKVAHPLIAGDQLLTFTAIQDVEPPPGRAVAAPAQGSRIRGDRPFKKAYQSTDTSGEPFTIMQGQMFGGGCGHSRIAGQHRNEERPRPPAAASS